MRSRLTGLAFFVLLGCGSAPEPDAGPRDAGGLDALPVTPCAQPADCEDGLFCTEHACQPGAAGADATGCVLIEGPCDLGTRCWEADRRCLPEGCVGEPDGDGDGDYSYVCGGNDCDPFDGTRYPGGIEVCDVDGHDEDCVDTTFGDRDADGDGFVDAACCNGGRCGPDCDDAARDISPAGREACNGRDDDCDGVTDEEGDEPLCPGGVCVGGRCDLAGWDRTYGGPANDDVVSVTMDNLGRVYIGGNFQGIGNFSGEAVETNGGSQDAFVAAYEADGRFAWVWLVGGPGSDRIDDVAYDPGSSLLYLLVDTEGGNLGAGLAGTGAGTVLVAATRDAEPVWHRQVSAESDLFTRGSVLVPGAGVTVAGTLAGAATIAGEAHRSSGAVDAWLVRFDDAGVAAWAPRFFDGGGDTGVIVIQDGAGNGDGRAVVTGTSVGAGTDLGLGFRTNSSPDTGNLFVAAVDADGATAWDYWDDSSARVFLPAIAADEDQVVVVGHFSGRFEAAGTSIEFPSSGASGFVLSQSRSDGAARSLRGWAWNQDLMGELTVGVTSSAEVIVAGSFGAPVDFGGGMRPAPMPGPPGPSRFAGFYAVFDSELRHRSDRVLTYSGWPDAPCAETRCNSEVNDVEVGPADSLVLVGGVVGTIDLGSGSRISAGNRDGFALRLPN